MKQKWPVELLMEKRDGKDWARRILERQNAGEQFSIMVTDMARKALGLSPEGQNVH